MTDEIHYPPTCPYCGELNTLIKREYHSHLCGYRCGQDDDGLEDLPF